MSAGSSGNYTPSPGFSPPLISPMDCVDVKHRVYRVKFRQTRGRLLPFVGPYVRERSVFCPGDTSTLHCPNCLLLTPSRKPPTPFPEENQLPKSGATWFGHSLALLNKVQNAAKTSLLFRCFANIIGIKPVLNLSLIHI